MAAVAVVLVGLAGVHDQLAIRQNVAHNLWAYPEQPPNGTAVDYQAAARIVEERARPGDVIAYQVSDQNHYQVDTSLNYYLQGQKDKPAPVFQAQTQIQAEVTAAGPVRRPVGLHLGHAADLGRLRHAPGGRPVLRASRQRGGAAPDPRLLHA